MLKAMRIAFFIISNFSLCMERQIGFYSSQTQYRKKRLHEDTIFCAFVI